MHLEKLVNVLKAFDEDRLKRLKDYVDSPYFKITPAASLLLERLSAHHPNYPEKKIRPEILGRKDHRICTAIKQSNVGSHLLRAIEQFLAQEEWQKNQLEMERLKLKGFQDLSLSDEYEKGYEKQVTKIANDPGQNVDLFMERHLLTELSLNNFNARLKRSAQNDIMPVVKTLDEFYALKKIRYLCEAINRNQFFGTQLTFHKQHFETLIHVLEPYTTENYPYVYLFVNVFRMLEEDTYNEGYLYYGLLKQFIEKQDDMEPSQSTREAVDYIMHYCLRWNNKGYEQASIDYLWWIDWKAKNNLLLENGKILPITFRNILMSSLKSRSPEWIDQMINGYSPHLPDEFRNTYLAFARGLYHYSLKNYKKAIRFFLKAQAREEVIFNSLIRRWQWMCLYEADRNDMETLQNHLLSFERYLNRYKKELAHLNSVFNRFIEYPTKLLESVGSENINHHLTELQNEEHFAGKAWLSLQFEAKSKKPVHKVHR